jgi:uncharacterized membrane protein
MSPKLKSILAHLTILGWIVAFIFNRMDPDSVTGFYLRQTLGLYLFILIGGLIPSIKVLIVMLLFVLWVFSFVGATQQQQKEIPYLGPVFNGGLKT